MIILIVIAKNCQNVFLTTFFNVGGSGSANLSDYKAKAEALGSIAYEQAYEKARNAKHAALDWLTAMTAPKAEDEAQNDQ